MESDQDMVAMCYLVSPFSGVVISLSPVPHFWTLHLQSLSKICVFLFRVKLQMIMEMKSSWPQVYCSLLDWPAPPFKDVP
jgi:hypothetical protein